MGRVKTRTNTYRDLAKEFNVSHVTIYNDWLKIKIKFERFKPWRILMATHSLEDIIHQLQ